MILGQFMTLFFAYSSCHVVSSSLPFEIDPERYDSKPIFWVILFGSQFVAGISWCLFLGCKTNFDVRVLQVSKSQNNRNSEAQLRFVFGMINSQLPTFAGSTGSAGPTGFTGPTGPRGLQILEPIPRRPAGPGTR